MPPAPAWITGRLVHLITPHFLVNTCLIAFFWKRGAGTGFERNGSQLSSAGSRRTKLRVVAIGAPIWIAQDPLMADAGLK
jgi:hypothetical protein